MTKFSKNVNIFIFNFYRDRIMVTLSSLIVLASLFSQLSSNLPDSPSPKAIEVLFFFYIGKLSYTFVCHAFMTLLKLYREHKEKKQKELDELFAELPASALSGGTLTNYVNWNNKRRRRVILPDSPKIARPSKPKTQISKKPTEHFPSIKLVNRICFYAGCAADFLFLGLGYMVVNIERKNRVSPVIDYL